MTLTEQDKQDFDNIEKWMVVSGLHGISIKELWDSNDEVAHDVLEKLETMDSYAAMLAEASPAVKVALTAHNSGITTDRLWAYQSWQNDLHEREQERLRIEEEAANPLVYALNAAHNLKITHGPSRHQIYWTFDADLGQGWTHYKCRLVSQGWCTQRIWREWTDAQGVKHKDKFEFGSTSNTFIMDHRWPLRWRDQYGRNFRRDQIPWAYTQLELDLYQKTLTPKRKRKAKQVQL